MHRREKNSRKTAKPQKGEVVALLKNNHHGDAVLLLVRHGGFWGFCLFAGLLSFFTKIPSEQRYDIRNTGGLWI